jgi:hypothetical protein
MLVTITVEDDGTYIIRGDVRLTGDAAGSSEPVLAP